MIDRETFWFLHYQMAKITVDCIGRIYKRRIDLEAKVMSAEFRLNVLKQQFSHIKGFVSLFQIRPLHFYLLRPVPPAMDPKKAIEEIAKLKKELETMGLLVAKVSIRS